MWRVLWLVAVLTAAPLVRAAEAARPKLLVFETKADRGVDPALAHLLDEELLTELSRRTHHEVIGGSDLKRLLSLASSRMSLGCDADDCLADIGGALGAEFLAAAAVGQVGSSFVVNLKIIDVKRGRVDRRWSETVPATEDALESAVRRSVAALYPENTRTAAWATAGVSAASVGVGVFLLRSALVAADRRNRATDGTTWDAAQADAQHFGTGANVAFGVGAVAAVVATVLFVR